MAQSGFITEATENGQAIQIPRHFGKYYYVRTIGSGASSIVVLVKEERTGQQYAAKAVDRKALVAEGKFEYFEREVRLLEKIDHPSIVRLYQTIYLDDVIILIMEYCPNGDLFEYISVHDDPCIITARSFLYQLLKGVEYLHSRNCAHRDLKPENIFLDARNRLKIGDLGLAKQADEGNGGLFSTICGTLYYTAPEIVRKEVYDGRKADIWSLGIIAYTLAVGRLPWEPVRPLEEQIMNADVQVPHTVCDPMARFIEACTRPDPDERPSIESLLKMEWIRDEEANWQREITRGPGGISQSKFSQTAKVVMSQQEKAAAVRRVLVRPIKATNSERLVHGNFFVQPRTINQGEQQVRASRIKVAPSAKLVRLNRSFM